MTARLRQMTAVDVEESDHVDLVRLDDDGGARQQSSVVSRPRMRDDRFTVPMIPGAREPGMLSTFGVPAAIIPDSTNTMNAATIAARQREGGGAPSERRGPHERSRWQNVTHALRLLVGVDRR
jgi:hypothetical protein